MFSKDWLNFDFLKSREDPSDVGAGTSNLITVYIVLFVLMEMKDQLGLEASLEYAFAYMKKIEKHNPKIKDLVCRALSGMNVEQMYKKAQS